MAKETDKVIRLTAEASADLFAGLEQAFVVDWGVRPWREPGQRLAQWNRIAEWANQFARDYYDIIPEPQFVRCAVETRQNYRAFGSGDLCRVLERLGRLANDLYHARRDVFGEGAMYRYYVDCLEWVTWMTATLCQPKPGKFVDLVTVMRRACQKPEEDNNDPKAD